VNPKSGNEGARVSGVEIDRLVCANADAPMTVKGSSFDHVCLLCKGRVMMAPSGQAKLRQEPATEVICYRCFVRTRDPKIPVRSVDTPENIAREVRNAIPNDWRRRN